MPLWCPDCDTYKSDTAFHVDRRRSSGRTRYCKACIRARGEVARVRKAEGLPAQPRRTKRLEPRPQATHKRCPGCGELKPLDDFVRNASKPSGRGGYCRPCQNIVGKRNTERLHGSTRTYHLKWRYGLIAAEVQELIDEQRGVCAICRVRPAEHVDHDHETGRVRGMLCFTCNVGIANFGEDRERMRFAMIYLEIHEYIKRKESA